MEVVQPERPVTAPQSKAKQKQETKNQTITEDKKPDNSVKGHSYNSARAMAGDTVAINVGGKRFQTSFTTLANAGRDSMLAALISDEWWNPDLSLPPAPSAPPEHFFDRNPVYFGILLDLLRTGELQIPCGVSERALYREALYYGVLDRVHAASWGRPLDGNRAELAASVAGRATGDATAIRAAQDGGCCVANGCMVHAYDWTLQQPGPPLTLDFQPVNDAAFLAPARLLICTCERIDRGGGGLALFNTLSGKPLQRFRVLHSADTTPKNFTAGALACAEADGLAFASCRGRTNEHGIAAWDAGSGSGAGAVAVQSEFRYDSDAHPLGDARKLQWLPKSRLLLAATLYPVRDAGFIALVDFRQRGVAWSWSGSAPSARRVLGDDKVVLDTVAMESASSICVVNQYDNLGFIDMRGGSAGIRWSHRTWPGEGEERCYSKLCASGQQLFSTKGDSVYVFCAPEWVVTSRLRKSAPGGSISDLAVGGDRLFVLHNDDDVFDVWQTPRPSGISCAYSDDDGAASSSW